MSAREKLAIAVVLLATAGCSSVGPLRPLSGGTARQAWHDLERSAEQAGTLTSYASIRVSTPEGKQSFRASLETDADGRVAMRAFTPVGTEVFAFSVSGGEMVFLDHSAKKAWRGPFAEVAQQLGIPNGVDAVDFARLSFGLPAGGAGADLSRVGDGVVRKGGLEYELTGVGLSRVSALGSDWSVRYEPATFPPVKVTLEDESRSIVVRHLDLSVVKGALEPLVIDPTYACCYRPVIGKE